MDPLVILAGCLAVAYLLSCRIDPWTSCWWCRGRTRRVTGRGDHWHDCYVCGGRGRRLRVGARFWPGHRHKVQ